MRSRRTQTRICILLFALSTLFPIAAGITVTDEAPRWLGIADVVFAAALFISAMIVVSANRKDVTDADRATAFRVSQIIAGLIPLLLVLFFALGKAINWQVFVIGLAWRSWLALYTLPFLAAAMRLAGEPQT